MRTQRLSTLSRLLAPPPRLVWDMKRSTPCETCTTENAQRLCTCFTLYASTAVRFPSVSLPNQNVVDMEHKPSSRPLHSILPSVSTVLPRIPETRATCALRYRAYIKRTHKQKLDETPSGVLSDDDGTEDGLRCGENGLGWSNFSSKGYVPTGLLGVAGGGGEFSKEYCQQREPSRVSPLDSRR